MRYFIYLSFKGTRYHGWQRQPRSFSIQEVLENVLTLKLGEEIIVTGAGRTDTGVHARNYCAHFDSSLENLGGNPEIIHKLNRFLPDHISIEKIIRVKPDASARFSAISRTYVYRVAREKDPFDQEGSWYVYGDLDIKTMNLAAAMLMEYKDFASFCRSNTDVKTTLCNVSYARWLESGHSLEFTITSNRFLRNMVRAITGSMIDIGQGKTSLKDFKSIIEAKDRTMAGQSAPAVGLYLTNIEYPDDIFIL